MKTIVSAVLALSVLAGVAVTSAKAGADYPAFGSSAWWDQQESEHN